MKSGEVRHFKAIDTRVLDAIKNHNPEVKIAVRILEELGLGDLTENEQDLQYVIEKYAPMLGLAQRNNGHVVSSRRGVRR